MINHCRTLLLNDAGTSPGADYPGEEYVPPSYVALTLPADLAAAHALVFPVDADRAFRNIRVAQLLSCVHAGVLDTTARAFDPRITYWPRSHDRLWRAGLFGAVARQSSGDTLPSALRGNPAVFVSPAVLYHRWRVRVTGSGQAHVLRLSRPTSDRVVSFTISSGWSSPVALHGSPLYLSFADPGSGFPEWQVTGLARPTPDPAGLLARLDARGTHANLFAGTGDYEVYRSLWQTPGVPAHLRLAAWTMALATRLDALFQSRG